MCEFSQLRNTCAMKTTVEENIRRSYRKTSMQAKAKKTAARIILRLSIVPIEESFNRRSPALSSTNAINESQDTKVNTKPATSKNAANKPAIELA
mmetsp:Transcript_29654/g.60371  ORF Transcript_29654/g.60371 Transcript_29654/m.60371 type:complete len:95 (-) Transcript_29654:661-945(-)